MDEITEVTTEQTEEQPKPETQPEKKKKKKKSNPEEKVAKAKRKEDRKRRREEKAKSEAEAAAEPMPVPMETEQPKLTQTVITVNNSELSLKVPEVPPPEFFVLKKKNKPQLKLPWKVTIEQIREYENFHPPLERVKKEDISEFFDTTDGLEDLLTIYFRDSKGNFLLRPREERGGVEEGQSEDNKQQCRDRRYLLQSKYVMLETGKYRLSTTGKRIETEENIESSDGSDEEDHKDMKPTESDEEFVDNGGGEDVEVDEEAEEGEDYDPDDKTVPPQQDESGEEEEGEEEGEDEEEEEGIDDMEVEHPTGPRDKKEQAKQYLKECAERLEILEAVAAEEAAKKKKNNQPDIKKALCKKEPEKPKKKIVFLDQSADNNCVPSPKRQHIEPNTVTGSVEGDMSMLIEYLVDPVGMIKKNDIKFDLMEAVNARRVQLINQIKGKPDILEPDEQTIDMILGMIPCTVLRAITKKGDRYQGHTILEHYQLETTKSEQKMRERETLQRTQNEFENQISEVYKKAVLKIKEKNSLLADLLSSIHSAVLIKIREVTVPADPKNTYYCAITGDIIKSNSVVHLVTVHKRTGNDSTAAYHYYIKKEDKKDLANIYLSEFKVHVAYKKFFNRNTGCTIAQRVIDKIPSLSFAKVDTEYSKLKAFLKDPDFIADIIVEFLFLKTTVERQYFDGLL